MNKDNLRNTNCNECKIEIHCKKHCNCQEIKKLYEFENREFN